MHCLFLSIPCMDCTLLLLVTSRRISNLLSIQELEPRHDPTVMISLQLRNSQRIWLLRGLTTASTVGVRIPEALKHLQVCVCALFELMGCAI
ncbi:hypothetical protein PENSPDRAFT_645589 [Peniophora sp. CONT]|nr:hypothetical protein PENSPDRAFT_645589 [Peniophora sp. CONT]